MRRAWVHVAFGIVALGCAAVAAYDWTRLKHAQDVAHAVADIGAKPARSADPEEPPEVRLARAIALSKAGSYADAQKLFDGLIQDEGSANRGVAHAALFDLGNMYVRQAIEGGSGDSIKSLPVLEQAKERYRVLLRASPDDWDARYNLERALWLAPETSEGADEPDVKEQHNVRLQGSQAQDLP
jgi:mxaK protein